MSFACVWVLKKYVISVASPIEHERDSFAKIETERRKRLCARAQWVCEQSVSFWLISLRTTRPHHADSTRETLAACVMVWLDWMRKPEVKNIVCDGRSMMRGIVVIHAKCAPLSHKEMGGLRSIVFNSATMMIFCVICHKTINIFLSSNNCANRNLYLPDSIWILFGVRDAAKQINSGGTIVDLLHKSLCSDYRLMWWSCEVNWEYEISSYKSPKTKLDEWGDRAATGYTWDDAIENMQAMPFIH